MVAQTQARGNIWRLALAQALSGANGIVVFATGSILGHELAPNPAWATVPVSVFVIGMALCILPLGTLTRRFGRKTAFLCGAGAGTLAGVCGAQAVQMQSFALFCTATALAGVYAAAVLGFRFAAADGVPPERKARALSWVMAGGVAAGIVGPQLVNVSMDMAYPRYAATFYVQAAVAALSAWVLSGLRLPEATTQVAEAAARPLGVIVRQGRFVAAVLCGAVSYLLMNFLMTAAPLAMILHGHAREAANNGLQWHVIAMFAPSFFTGRLIERFGVITVSACGLLLIGASVAVALAGESVAVYWAFLVLLGVGWNFGFLGASALVLQCHRPAERTRVQSLNDFLIFSVMAAGSLASGGLLHAYGWTRVLQMALLPLALALCVLAVMRTRLSDKK